MSTYWNPPSWSIDTQPLRVVFTKNKWPKGSWHFEIRFGWRFRITIEWRYLTDTSDFVPVGWWSIGSPKWLLVIFSVPFLIRRYWDNYKTRAKSPL